MLLSFDGQAESTFKTSFKFDKIVIDEVIGALRYMRDQNTDNALFESGLINTTIGILFAKC